MIAVNFAAEDISKTPTALNNKPRLAEEG